MYEITNLFMYVCMPTSVRICVCTFAYVFVNGEGENAGSES